MAKTAGSEILKGQIKSLDETIESLGKSIDILTKELNEVSKRKTSKEAIKKGLDQDYKKLIK